MPDENAPGAWKQIHRNGTRTHVDFTEDIARSYAENAVKSFGVGPNRTVSFDKERAKEDAKKGKKSKKN